MPMSRCEPTIANAIVERDICVVPPSQYSAMRAPFQEGDFPGPLKYGYLNVGVVEQGPPDLHGRTVFCLYPHQTAYVVPAGAVTASFLSSGMTSLANSRMLRSASSYGMPA